MVQNQYLLSMDFSEIIVQYDLQQIAIYQAHITIGYHFLVRQRITHIINNHVECKQPAQIEIIKKTNDAMLK